MYILMSDATATVRELVIRHPNLGVLIYPRDGSVAPKLGTVWAADTSSSFDDAVFLQMLKRIEDRGDCRFVTTPSVAGDHEATLRIWSTWNTKIRNYGLTPAFVAQDGCLPDSLPWRDLGAVFISGTTRYRSGEAAAAIICQGNRMNIWTHICGVNTVKLATHAAALCARSIDGRSTAQFEWALRLSKQPPLGA